ncbi:MAG: 3-dehydroquinate synthase [Acidiferrobacterales bacterium]|nr:3-dehydroquinate synthase [Acidiferrobacterales bacterium]
MNEVHIALDERSYDIHIGKALLSDHSLLTSSLKGRQVVVISNETVAPLYLEQIERALVDYEVHTILLSDGEHTKNLNTYSEIIDQMIAVPCDRRCTIIALGGGVIGDIAGFVAATYQRGIPFVQVPTTLLAQVDSSVGGKTGVNHPVGKNMIGAFHQPQKVITDLDTLSTLDDRQFSAGLAEVIKYGLINDFVFFQWIEQNLEKVMSKDADALTFIISRSCESKRDIVEQDEQEQGVRALLNLGHTFGHAIETATEYVEWLHGEAVALGMVMAADLSRRLGWIDQADCQRLNQVLVAARLPVALRQPIDPVVLRKLMQGDKKVLDGSLRLVLMKSLGEAVIVEDVDNELIMETLQGFAG